MKSLFFLLPLVVLAGCVDKSRDLTSPFGASLDTNDFDRGALMTNLVDNIFIPNYKTTSELAADFASESGAVANYCASIDSLNETSKLSDARTAWRGLMDSVQKTEMHIIGPAANNNAELNNRLNSYRGVFEDGSAEEISKCGIDVAVTLLAADNYNVATRASNQRGLGAIEYLLFNEDLTHNCGISLSATQDWNNLSQSAKKTQRCDLAMTLANDVAEASATIHNQWTAGDSPYRTEFLSEASRADNFQQITDALFYIETYTKSEKLFTPLGLPPNSDKSKCSAITCPDLIESPYSESSLRNIKVNAEEFLRIFNGADGVGFYDLIADAGQPYIANRFRTQLQQVIDRIESIDTSLYDQVSSITSSQDKSTCESSWHYPNDADSLDACSVASLLKLVTDDLKIEFVLIVDVPIPGSVQSDND